MLLKPSLSIWLTKLLELTDVKNHSTTGIYLFKINNGNTRTICGVFYICNTRKRRLDLFTKLVNGQHCSGVLSVDFEQVNAG